MEPKTISLNQYPVQLFNLESTTLKMNLHQVFAGRNPQAYLNEFTLFVAHFNAIPNSIHEIEIDCKKLRKFSLSHVFNKTISTEDEIINTPICVDITV